MEKIDFSEGSFIALGGNAIARGDDLFSKEAVGKSVEAIARMVPKGRLALGHGNGPQVGEIMSRHPQLSAAAAIGMTQTLIGNMIMGAYRGLKGNLRSIKLHQTSVLVDYNDPTFSKPVKGVGPWLFVDDWNQKYSKNTPFVRHPEDSSRVRMAVPSPDPQKVLGVEHIRAMYDGGYAVICGGGGGMPVVPAGKDRYRPVEKFVVLDKDLTAAKIASELKAAVLMILTGSDGVMEKWGSKNAKQIPQMSLSDADYWLQSEDAIYGEGSMTPKVAAAASFVQSS
jgi:carbamate kinase